MKYVDIHTHKNEIENDVIAVRNVSLGEFKNIPTHVNRLFSLGIHPWELENTTESDLKLLEKLASDNRVKLIGECGFDKNIHTDFETQLFFFKKQTAVSEKLQKPLIIHCVGYYNELFTLKKELNPTQKWIIHGFRGKPPLARQALKHGFYLSYGEKHNAESIEITPLQNLFIETDESKKSIKEIYKSISEIKKCNVTDLISEI